MTYRHIVLFRVHDAVEAASLDEAIRHLRGLAALPGVLSWSVERSLDARKGTVIVEDATFVDRAAYEAFRRHPLHQHTTKALAQISDWWVGDYLTE